VQKLLSLIRKPCRFKVHGCKMVISKLDQHEINCAYRVVLCIFETCCWQLPMPKLIAHLQTFHPTHLNFMIPIEPRLKEVSNIGGGYFSHQNKLADKIFKTGFP
jgi:hypothetical protein